MSGCTVSGVPEGSTSLLWCMAKTPFALMSFPRSTGTDLSASATRKNAAVPPTHPAESVVALFSWLSWCAFRCGEAGKANVWLGPSPQARQGRPHASYELTHFNS